jgi:four helix bundle protein
MRPPLRQEILNHSLQVITLVRPIVEMVARRDRDLASQIRRAMSSVSLNLAEGFGTAAGNARLRFETARGSLYEVETGIGVAVAWGFAAPENVATALEAIDHLGARIFWLARR